MKDATFKIKKMTVRALMAIGATLGLAACFHQKNYHGNPAEAVYGPPPGNDNPVEVIEDVYGPPVMTDEPDTLPDAKVAEPAKPAPKPKTEAINP